MKREIILRSISANSVGLSGIITTNPFKMSTAEKNYENLYKSRREVSEQNAPCFRYDDLPIPTLSPYHRSRNALNVELFSFK